MVRSKQMLKKLFKRGLFSILIGAGIAAFFQNLISLAARAVSGSPDAAFIGILTFIKLSLFYSLIPFLILTIISLFSKDNKTK